MSQCRSCLKPMNPVEAMLGEVCGQCCRENQMIANGKLSELECVRKRMVRVRKNMRATPVLQ